MDEESRVANLIDDRPDLESALADVLAVDEEADTWTFDDVPVESGSFGELVSRGIVVTEEGDYRLADAEQVRASLFGDETQTVESPRETSSRFDLSVPDIDFAGVGMLLGALVLVAIVRLFAFRAVFRGDHVVLAANDPYAYLYWVEQAVTAGQPLASGFGQGEPLLVATLAGAADLLGGVGTAGFVLAVYPVAAAVVTAGLLYGIALRVTDDRRVGLASVTLLAMTPGNAFRTALGFADHHAFDYVWLVLTAAALVALAGVKHREQLRSWRPWAAACGLGIGVGFQILAWNNGPLLFAPVGIVFAGRAVLDAREGRSPLIVTAPMLAGLALGAIVAGLGHVVAGWHSTAVVLTPLLLVGVGLAVAVGGELTRYFDRRARDLAVLEAVIGVTAAVGTWAFLPDLTDRVLRGLGLIGRTDPIAEVRALFSGDTLGFLLLFGFVLVIALPVLAWATWRVVDGSTRWLVPVVYGWYFFVLSLFQVRFTGQLAYFTALFGGLGFVWLAAKVELAMLPAAFGGVDLTGWTPDWPDSSTVVGVVVLLLLVGGIGLLQSGVKVHQITTDEASYETAAWLEDYAEEQGWDSPEESYVLTQWGENRMYNYFVNGESSSYGYARSTYGDFIGARDPDAAVSMLNQRVRFVVTRSLDADEQTMQARLHDNFGSRNGAVAGTGHFRAVYVTGGGDRTAFVYVPGANVTGQVTPNATVALSTTVQIPDKAFTYERQTTANSSGAFAIRVAYPGTYEVSVGENSWSVVVEEQAVMDGADVPSNSSAR